FALCLAFLGRHLTVLVRIGHVEAGERRGLEFGLADRLVAIGIGLAHHHHAVTAAALAVVAAHAVALALASLTGRGTLFTALGRTVGAMLVPFGLADAAVAVGIELGEHLCLPLGALGGAIGGVELAVLV